MSEPTIDNPQLFTQQFIESFAYHEEGFMKTASDAATKMTRRKLREDAFSPAILPYEDITNADLDRFIDSEYPAMICDMEPDSFGAKSITFNDTGDTAPFYGDKFLLTFYANTTPEWTKDMNLLRTYRGDIREMITDNSLRDLSRRRDAMFMKDVDAIVGAIDGGVSDITGLNQNVLYPGRMSKNNWISSTLLLGDRDLLNGVFLCNRRTFAEVHRWGREELGGDFVQDLTLKGNAAFEKSQLGGIDFIVTMKHDLVPNGVIYQFTKPNYLGRAGVLEKPTMYVKKEKDILRFSCREVLGVAIANVAGVQKVTFQDIANSTGGDGRLPAQIV